MKGLGTDTMKRGGASIRFSDSTRVINSGDTFEMRNVTIAVDGHMKESLEFLRSVLYPGMPWYAVMSEIINKGISEYAGLAFFDREHTEAGQ